MANSLIAALRAATPSSQGQMPGAVQTLSFPWMNSGTSNVKVSPVKVPPPPAPPPPPPPPPPTTPPEETNTPPEETTPWTPPDGWNPYDKSWPPPGNYRTPDIQSTSVDFTGTPRRPHGGPQLPESFDSIMPEMFDMPINQMPQMPQQPQMQQQMPQDQAPIMSDEEFMRYLPLLEQMR